MSIKRDFDRWTFQVYVTDTLRAMTENTAASAVACAALCNAWGGRFNMDGLGKTMPTRWIERDKPAPPEEARTADEVIEHIRGKLASL